MKEDGDEGRHDVLQHMADDMALQIEVGQYGALNTSIENACHGYYLVQFLGTPYIDQESGKLLCKIWYWEEIAYSNVPWFSPVTFEDIIEVNKLVMANVVLK